MSHKQNTLSANAVSLLNKKVSRAILVAERADDEREIGHQSEIKVRAAWMQVANLERHIVDLTQAGTPEGDIARAGAVSAYVACGEIDRARELANGFLSDPALGEARKKEIAAMVA